MARVTRLGLVVAAVLVGGSACRQQAPPPRTLANGFSTPQELAAQVVTALAEGDRARLVAMSLSEAEFRDHVWPHLPASRPERNLPFEYVWGDLRQKSLDSLDQTLARMRGERLIVSSIAFTGDASQYGTARVQRDSLLTVRATDGTTREVRLFGSVLDQHGTYKVFSYVVD